MNTGQISLGIILAYLCFMLAITVLMAERKNRRMRRGSFLLTAASAPCFFH